MDASKREQGGGGEPDQARLERFKSLRSKYDGAFSESVSRDLVGLLVEDSGGQDVDYNLTLAQASVREELSRYGSDALGDYLKQAESLLAFIDELTDGNFLSAAQKAGGEVKAGLKTEVAKHFLKMGEEVSNMILSVLDGGRVAERMRQRLETASTADSSEVKELLYRSTKAALEKGLGDYSEDEKAQAAALLDQYLGGSTEQES